MINETVICNQTAIYQLATITAKGIIDLLKTNHAALVFLAIIGVFATVSAIGQKIMDGFRYLFMIFIAVPIILIMGLINRKHRRERLEQLGEIKAFLRKNPERWKILLFWAIAILFVIAILVVFVWLQIYFRTAVNVTQTINAAI